MENFLFDVINAARIRNMISRRGKYYFYPDLSGKYTVYFAKTSAQTVFVILLHLF
jgi:hypothetical protein